MRTGRGRARRYELRDDPELVAGAREGDRAALETLLRRHHDRLHLLCHRMCVDRGDAEDATQEALVAIVRGLDRYDGRAAFSTWAYRVTTNACLDQLRRRARRPPPADVSLIDAHDRVTDPRIAPGAGGPDPADRVVSAEQRARLDEALAELPEAFRVPVILRDVADLDYAEIARILDLPPGTVRSRIARGRARLAAALPGLRDGSAPGLGTPTEPHGNRSTTPDVRPLDGP